MSAMSGTSPGDRRQEMQSGVAIRLRRRCSQTRQTQAANWSSRRFGMRRNPPTLASLLSLASYLLRSPCLPDTSSIFPPYCFSGWSLAGFSVRARRPIAYAAELRRRKSGPPRDRRSARRMQRSFHHGMLAPEAERKARLSGRPTSVIRCCARSIRYGTRRTSTRCFLVSNVA